MAIAARSMEDVNFLRLAGLLLKIAPHAVRQMFDHEFHPVMLQQILRKNRLKIDELVTKRVITKAQYNLLFPEGKVLRYLKKYSCLRTIFILCDSSLGQIYEFIIHNQLACICQIYIIHQIFFEDFS